MPSQPPPAPAAVPSAPRALWTVMAFLGRRPGWVALSVSLLLVNIGIELILPQFLGNAITRLQDPVAAQNYPLAWSVVVFSGLVLLRTLVGLILGPIRNRTAITTLGDIRAAVYDGLQRKSFAWHDNARTGELISRAVTDVGRLQEFLFVCLLFSVDVLAGLLGTLVLVFLVSAPLGFIALGSMLPTVVAMGYFAIRLQPRWRRVHDRHGAMSTVIQENIAGVRVVKAFA
ncbi:MAG: ABC transporter transmembrane domain-containing protein, partial [Verrucomicrobiota bacterium]